MVGGIAMKWQKTDLDIWSLFKGTEMMGYVRKMSEGVYTATSYITGDREDFGDLTSGKRFIEREAE